MPLLTKKNPLAPGEPITIPGAVIYVPELQSGQRQDNPEILERWARRDKSYDELMELAKDTVLMCLQMNYPDAVMDDLRVFSNSQLLKASQFCLAGPLAPDIFAKAVPMTAPVPPQSEGPVLANGALTTAS